MLLMATSRKERSAQSVDVTSRIEELNRRFGISGMAEVVAGHGGLPKVRIATAAASAEIYLHGAQVTQWQPSGGEEALFLSEKSRWDDGRAIRGGIPVCFPWFRGKADNAKAPAHGFVRTREWRLESVAALGGGSATVECSTESDDSTRQWWPHEFRLVLKAEVGRVLRLELTACNPGPEAFRMEEALHTYLRVRNAQAARLRGLDGVTYLDNLDANKAKIQAGDLSFASPTDNAYLTAQSAVDLVDPGMRRVIRTVKENSATTVVWNPWQQGAAALADLGEEEWRQFVCVEASNILAGAAEVEPGAKHTMTAEISVEPF